MTLRILADEAVVTDCDAEECGADGPRSFYGHVARAMATNEGWLCDASRGRDLCPEHRPPRHDRHTPPEART